MTEGLATQIANMKTDIALLRSELKQTQKSLAEVTSTLKDLTTIATMGRGIWWFILKVGAVAVFVLGIFEVASKMKWNN